MIAINAWAFWAVLMIFVPLSQCALTFIHDESSPFHSALELRVVSSGPNKEAPQENHLIIATIFNWELCLLGIEFLAMMPIYGYGYEHG